jgi:hypothetical protein
MATPSTLLAAAKASPLAARVDAQLDALEGQATRAFVTFMLSFMGRALLAVSATDAEARAEIEGFAEGFTFEMKVLPSGPAIRLRKQGGRFVADAQPTRPTLAIQFKHLRHAARVLSFVESTPQAFANDRMVVDGDVALAMRMQRILDRMQSILLPHVVAARALKRAPVLPLAAHAKDAARLYGRMARELVA